MSYQSLNTGQKVDTTVKNIFDPTKFEGSSTSENSSPHIFLVLESWMLHS